MLIPNQTKIKNEQIPQDPKYKNLRIVRYASNEQDKNNYKTEISSSNMNMPIILSLRLLFAKKVLKKRIASLRCFILQ
ncbi:hypothetical protein CON84_00460 [Bacillus sp. AFS094228]|nr:hypothetical protein CON84_00460 [Bacillus sp. AFS094228]